MILDPNKWWVLCVSMVILFWKLRCCLLDVLILIFMNKGPPTLSNWAQSCEHFLLHFFAADLEQFVVEALDLCHVVFCQVLEDRRHAHVFLDRGFVQSHPQLAAHPLHFVAIKKKRKTQSFWILHTHIVHRSIWCVCRPWNYLWLHLQIQLRDIYWEVSGLLLMLYICELAPTNFDPHVW